MDWTEKLAREYRAKIEKAAALQSDEDALESIELFPKWEAGIAVAIGERYQYNTKLYKVIQAHTTQADWTPDITPALFKEVSLDEFPEWVQPTGAHDAYNKGDKVTFEGKHYMSLIDGNIWSPAAYPAGWEEQL
jgi:chitodextrinase